MQEFYDFNDKEKFEPLIDLIVQCKDVEQCEKYHPEGNVMNHTLQVLSWAFRESNDIDLIVAAMLHDVGKIVESHGHEQHSVELCNGFITEKTKWLILNHMKFWYYVEGDMKKLSKVNLIANHKWLPELTQLARWDKIGRNPNRKMQYDKDKIIERFNKLS